MATDKETILIEVVDRASAQIASIARGLTGLAAAYVSFRGAEAALRLLASGIQAASAAAIQQEKADVALANSLKLAGDSSAGTLEQLKLLASGLQRTTNFTDDQIQETEALLVSIGRLSGQGLERATRLTADLAAGLGIDLHSATMLVAKAAQGHTEALGRYGFAVREGLSAQEKFVEVLGKIEERFGGRAQAAASTFGGRLQEIADQWGEVIEAVGMHLQKSPELNTALEATGTALAEIAKNLASANFQEGIGDLVSGLTEIGAAAARASKWVAFLMSPIGAGQNPLLKFADEAIAGFDKISSAVEKVQRERDELAALTLERSLFGDFANTEDLDRWIELQEKFGTAWVERVTPGVERANSSLQATVNTWHGMKIAIDEAGKATTSTIEEVEVLPEIFMTAVEPLDTMATGLGACALAAAGFSTDMSLIDGILPGTNEQFGQTKVTMQDLVDISRELEASARRQNANIQLQRNLWGAVIGAAQTLGSTLVQAAFGAKISWGEFFKQLIAQFVEAIIQALILRAIETSLLFVGGGGQVTGPTGGVYVQSGGEILKAQHGLQVPGPRVPKDSVRALLTPGEVVLRTPVVEEIERVLEGAARGGGGGTVVINNSFASTSKRSAVEEYVEEMNRLARYYGLTVVATEIAG